MKTISRSIRRATHQVRTSPVPPAILRALRRVIARQLYVHLGECAALLLTALPALWLFQSAADDAFNLPFLVRGCLLLADMGLAAYLVALYALRPWRRRLSLPTAALLVESVIPEYRSALISAVQLSQAPSGSPALARALIVRVGKQLRSGRVAGRVVDTRRLKRWSKWALASVAVAAGVLLVFAPKSHVLLARLFLSREPLPTRTTVIAISGDAAIPLGADVSLSARGAGFIPRSGRLLLAFANGSEDDMLVQPRTDDPVVFAVELRNVQQSFRYHFELDDGVGATFHVTAQVPPAIASCKFTQNYPAYTGRRATEMSAGNLVLLAGSRIRVNGIATQALRSAKLQFEGAAMNASQLRVSGDSMRAMEGEFTVPKDGLTGFSVLLVNADGVASTENTVYRVDFLPDRPPVVELTAPVAERSTVSIAARPSLRFSVRDDFGIQQVTLRYEVERPAADGEEPAKNPGEVRLPSPAGVASLDGAYAWDLATQKPELSAGCTVQYWIEAVDNNNVTGPGIGQSARKMLVLVSEQEEQTELLQRLGAGAAGVEELYQNQLKANEELNTTVHQGAH